MPSRAKATRKYRVGMGYREKNRAQPSGVRRQGEECAAAIALGGWGKKKPVPPRAERRGALVGLGGVEAR